MQRHARCARGWVLLLLVACTRSGGGADSAADARADGRRASSGLSARDTTALEEAATRIVSFLSNDADFETLALADTVEFHAAAHGPGGSHAPTRVGRDALRDRFAWRVAADSASTSIVPSGLVGGMTVRAGVHFDCGGSRLASYAPALARRPHVGVRLDPPEPGGCTDAWRATFVFDTTGDGPPRLTAVVYDPGPP